MPRISGLKLSTGNRRILHKIGLRKNLMVRQSYVTCWVVRNATCSADRCSGQPFHVSVRGYTGLLQRETPSHEAGGSGTHRRVL